MYTATYEDLPGGGVAFTIYDEDGLPRVYQPHNPYADGGFPKMDRPEAEGVAAQLIAFMEEADEAVRNAQSPPEDPTEGTE